MDTTLSPTLGMAPELATARRTACWLAGWLAGCPSPATCHFRLPLPGKDRIDSDLSLSLRSPQRPLSSFPRGHGDPRTPFVFAPLRRRSRKTTEEALFDRTGPHTRIRANCPIRKPVPLSNTSFSVSNVSLIDSGKQKKKKREKHQPLQENNWSGSFRLGPETNSLLPAALIVGEGQV